MKKMLFTSFLIASSLFAQDEITGNWNTGNNNTVVMIHQKESGEYAGTVVTSDNSDAIRKEILRDVSKDNGQWDGKFYFAKRDRLLDATLSPRGDILEINIGTGRRSKTVEWTRADSE